MNVPPVSSKLALFAICLLGSVWLIADLREQSNTVTEMLFLSTTTVFLQSLMVFAALSPN
jgi:hypothetical protein